MKIEISKKDYDILLKHIAIGNWVYGIMSDSVDSKYQKEAEEGDELIHKVLKYCDDKNIKDVFEGKNIFADNFGDMITNDMTAYENYVVEDLTGIDIEKIDREIEEDFPSNPLFNK